MLERKTIGKYFNDFRLKKDFINLTKQKSMKKNTDKFECIKNTNFRVLQTIPFPCQKRKTKKKGGKCKQYIQ